MIYGRQIRRFLPGYAFVAGFVLLTSVLLWARAARQLQREDLADRLRAEAVLVRGILQQWQITHPQEELGEYLERLGADTGTVLTVFSRDGRVIASTTPQDVRASEDYPEVHRALTQRRGVAMRPADPGGPPWVYVAVPLSGERGPIGAIRAARPLDARPVPPLGGALGVLAAVIVLAGVVVLAAWYTAHRIVSPIDELRRAIVRLGDGHIPQRIPVPEHPALAPLVEGFNAVSTRWNARLQSALRQRNQQEAVLSSMVEGVLAVDNSERIISINQAAARLIGVAPPEAQGQALAEIVRNSALQNFVAKTLGSAEPLEEEIKLHQHGGTQIIKAHGARLRDTDGAGIGAVMVFNDITDLRRLEQIRRDFVSNVSHELKTPITSIKGFVETLLDGAIENPDEARRFLEIVSKQAERLQSIIEDLLTLSRLEHGDQPADELLAIMPLRPTLQEAIDLCLPAADLRDIRIELACASDLEARINPTLLEQGLVNLIDNAVKYSGDHSEVSVEAIEDSDETLIFVRDQGCGIAPDHLPRLFERFYRVDKARSREMGGTGLGLSIVRHIVQSHDGWISVDSAAGVGSSFCIHLPKPSSKTDAGASRVTRSSNNN